jgi:hypothetical protein
MFEVVVYNRNVRALVKDNMSHRYYDDHWADSHVQDVEADDEAEARAKMAHRFPPEEGFVIEAVYPVAV